MKKTALSILALITMSLGLSAQGTQDLFRYSYNDMHGTARFMGLGGSFGALGGDLSAISYNPGGIGVFQTSSINFTPALHVNSTKTHFNGEINTDRSINFIFNNVGMVMTFKAPRDMNGTAGDRWESSSFAITYTRKNNFNEDYKARGRNWESSVSDVFVDEAAEYGIDDYTSIPTYAAWETFLLDEFDDFETLQTDFTANNQYSQTQEFIYNNSGHQGSLDFSFGGNYAHKLYVGAALGIEFIDFRLEKFVTEEDDRNAIPGFNSMNFNEYIDVRGSGMNLKLGAIYRPLPFLRIGAALHTPTWIGLTDYYTGEMTTNITFDDETGAEEYYYSESYDPFDYSITTPYRLIGSVALLDGRIGAINAEVEFVDYTFMFADAEGVDNMSEVNDAVPEIYQAVVNMRLGGELVYGPFALRGGFGYYPSPYQDNDGEANADNDRFVYSAGVGYNAGSFYVDLAMLYSKYQHTDYHYQYGGYDYANNSSKTDGLNVTSMLTIGWLF